MSPNVNPLSAIDDRLHALQAEHGNLTQRLIQIANLPSKTELTIERRALEARIEALDTLFRIEASQMENEAARTKLDIIEAESRARASHAAATLQLEQLRLRWHNQVFVFAMAVVLSTAFVLYTVIFQNN